jgi:hypothetical protein
MDSIPLVITLVAALGQQIPAGRWQQISAGRFTNGQETRFCGRVSSHSVGTRCNTMIVLDGFDRVGRPVPVLVTVEMTFSLRT